MNGVLGLGGISCQCKMTFHLEIQSLDPCTVATLNSSTRSQFPKWTLVLPS